MSDIETGRLYSYTHEGEEKMAVLEIITRPINNVKWCRMDNGDQMPLQDFMGNATMIDESDGVSKPIRQSSNQAVPVDENVQSDINKLTQIQTDGDGVPILQPSQNSENSEDLPVVSPKEFKEQQAKNDPVIKLLEKASTKEVKLSIDLNVKVVDKKLVNVIVESFGEESKKTIHEFIMNSISSEQFKESVGKIVEDYYNEEKE